MTDLLPAATGLVGVLAGALLTPRVTAGQAHRAWLRDKRAETYAKYAEVLQKVQYVVGYDDSLNYRLGNDAQQESLDASIGLDDVTADFNVYASYEMKELAQKIHRSFLHWKYGATLRDMTQEERLQFPEGQRPLPSSGRVMANPLEPDYPWEKIEAAGVRVLSEMEELLETIRSELRVDDLPWYRMVWLRLHG